MKHDIDSAATGGVYVGCVKMGQVRGRPGRGWGEDGETRGDGAVSSE